MRQIVKIVFEIFVHIITSDTKDEVGRQRDDRMTFY